MIKRVVEISSQALHVSTSLGQLLLSDRDRPAASALVVNGHSPTRTVPLEDIGLLMIDHSATTITAAALSSLADNGVAVCLCGSDHLPVGLLLPLANRHETVWRINDQMATTRPTRKNLWRQIVRAKIQGQKANLLVGSPAYSKLSELRDSVRSGDPGNVESQAARVYWANWLGTGQSFMRAGGEGDRGAAPNSLLDYGYAVIRAALARAIVSAGLVPAIGVHHSHRSNSFCLADDLIEPLRPMIDRRVRSLYLDGVTTVSREAKESLLSMLTFRVAIPSDDSTAKLRTGPLGVALHRYVASFVECLPDFAHRRRLAIPRFCRK